jgi:hypothetical protein
MADGHDLGFNDQVFKSGDVASRHHGEPAPTLRGTKADEARRRIALATPGEAQQLMARLTGNDKRGNERR